MHKIILLVAALVASTTLSQAQSVKVVTDTALFGKSSVTLEYEGGIFSLPLMASRTGDSLRMYAKISMDDHWLVIPGKKVVFISPSGEKTLIRIKKVQQGTATVRRAATKRQTQKAIEILLEMDSWYTDAQEYHYRLISVHPDFLCVEQIGMAGYMYLQGSFRRLDEHAVLHDDGTNRVIIPVHKDGKLSAVLYYSTPFINIGRIYNGVPNHFPERERYEVESFLILPESFELPDDGFPRPDTIHWEQVSGRMGEVSIWYEYQKTNYDPETGVTKYVLLE